MGSALTIDHVAQLERARDDLVVEEPLVARVAEGRQLEAPRTLAQLLSKVALPGGERAAVERSREAQAGEQERERPSAYADESAHRLLMQRALVPVTQ